jgi:hypothetical protein
MTLAYGEKLCTPVWSLSTARRVATEIANERHELGSAARNAGEACGGARLGRHREGSLA